MTGPCAAMLPQMASSARSAGCALNERWEKSRWNPVSTPIIVTAYIPTSREASSIPSPWVTACVSARIVPASGTSRVTYA